MKLHILNDLHVEFEDFYVPDTDADVVILAGDIGVGFGGLNWAVKRIPDKPVIYVPGNHEFYHHDISFIDELKSRARGNIHVLDNDELIIDGVRFLGSTLWTDFSLNGVADEFPAMRYAGNLMSDFHVIENSGVLFTPHDSVRIHEVSRKWISDMLDIPYDGKTVVVTHHAPSSMSLHPKYEGSRLNPAFMSKLEYLMGEDRAVLWLHGHTHESFDYEVYGTRVICNPRGVCPHAPNQAFRADLMTEI